MYLVLDVGCLECVLDGEETIVVGVFENKEQAEDVYIKLGGHKQGTKYIQMFELPTMNTIGAEYIDKVQG